MASGSVTEDRERFHMYKENWITPQVDKFKEPSKVATKFSIHNKLTKAQSKLHFSVNISNILEIVL